MRWSYRLSLVLVFVSSLPLVASENLLRNGSFECGTKYWLEKFQLVTDDVPHGATAARVEKYIRSAPFAVRVGKKITIAFWARADKAGAVAVAFAPTDRDRMREGGKPGFQAFFGKPTDVVELTTEWKRHSLEVTVPAGVGDRSFGDAEVRSFFLVLGKPEKAGFALYDGVTVAYDGAGKDEYISEAPVEVGVQATNLPGYVPHANIYPAGAEVKLKAFVFNPSSAARSVALRWQLLDYTGERRLSTASDEKLDLPAGKAVPVEHSMKLEGRGLQLARLTVRGDDDQLLGQSDQPVTCLGFPKAATKFDPAERFGGTLVAGQPVRSHMVGVAREIGLAWSRWYPQMNWQAIQPARPSTISPRTASA